MDAEMLERGCTCPFGAPPCSFCTGMDEGEMETYCEGGHLALREHVEFTAEALARLELRPRLKIMAPSLLTVLLLVYGHFSHLERLAPRWIWIAFPMAFIFLFVSMQAWWLDGYCHELPRKVCDAKF